MKTPQEDSDQAFDDLFREKFADFTVSPAEQLWQNIAQELQASPRDKWRGGWWFWGGFLGIFLLLGLGLHRDKLAAGDRLHIRPLQEIGGNTSAVQNTKARLIGIPNTTTISGREYKAGTQSIQSTSISKPTPQFLAARDTVPSIERNISATRDTMHAIKSNASISTSLTKTQDTTQYLVPRPVPQPEQIEQTEQKATDIKNIAPITSLLEMPKPLQALPDTQQIKLRKPWHREYFSVYVAPTFTHQTLLPNTNDNIIINKVETAPSISRRNTGWQVGVGYERQIHYRWSVSATVAFKILRSEIGYQFSRNQADSLSLQWIDGQNVSMTAFFEQNYRKNSLRTEHASLQAALAYHTRPLGQLRSRVSLGAGIDQVVASRSIGDDASTTHRQTLASLSLAWQLRYPISPRVELGIEPRYTRYVQNIGAASAYQLNPETFELRISFHLRQRYRR